MERSVPSPFPSNGRFSLGAHLYDTRTFLSSAASNEHTSMNASRNPLSLRLYKSLSSNFQDAASREALEVLSSLYGDSSENFSGSRTTPHDEDTSSSHEEDAPELHNRKNGFAGCAIEPDPLGNIAIAERARKNSLRDVEQVLIANSIRFLHAFGDVNKVCLLL